MPESLFPRTLAEARTAAIAAGRPGRNAVIGTDDVFNLRIALGLHRDVLEICADPHLFSPAAPVTPGAAATYRRSTSGRARGGS